MIQTTEEVKLTKKITPLGTNILVLVEDINSKIMLTESARNKLMEELSEKVRKPLYVTAIGEQVKTVKVGDYISIRKNAQISFMETYDTGVNGYQYALIQLHDIQAIISDFE